MRTRNLSSCMALGAFLVAVGFWVQAAVDVKIVQVTPPEVRAADDELARLAADVAKPHAIAK